MSASPTTQLRQITLPDGPEALTACIAQLLYREAACWAIHARLMERYSKALKALPARPAGEYSRFSDPGPSDAEVAVSRGEQGGER